jgi:hypothetical protein
MMTLKKIVLVCEHSIRPVDIQNTRGRKQYFDHSATNRSPYSSSQYK